MKDPYGTAAIILFMVSTIVLFCGYPLIGAIAYGGCLVIAIVGDFKDKKRERI